MIFMELVCSPVVLPFGILCEIWFGRLASSYTITKSSGSVLPRGRCYENKDIKFQF